MYSFFEKSPHFNYEEATSKGNFSFADFLYSRRIEMAGLGGEV